MPPKTVLSVLHNVEPEYPDLLKKEIFEAIGDISHIEVWGQEVLVAAFIQSPYFGKSRMLKGDKQQEEDKWQSKCFMVLKLGTTAEAIFKSKGMPVPQVGDWCYGQVIEHWQTSIRGIGAHPWKDEKDASKLIRPWGEAGWPCRYVLAGDFRGRTTRPQDII